MSIIPQTLVDKKAIIGVVKESERYLNFPINADRYTG